MKPWFYWMCRGMTLGFLRVWVRLRARGAEHLPVDGGVLVVANHASYLDPPIVGSSLPRRVRFMARSTLRRIPLVGHMLDALGVLFIEREGSARGGIRIAIETLLQDEAVCMFPEGTRTRDGVVAPFKRGVLLVLRAAPVPVVPAGIVGSYGAMRRGMLFIRPRKCAIRFGEPMSAAEVLAPGGLEELRRRVMELGDQPPQAEVRDTALDSRVSITRPDTALGSAAVCSMQSAAANYSTPSGRSGAGVICEQSKRDSASMWSKGRADSVPVASS